MKLKTSNKVYNERIDICKGCKFFRKSVSQCKKCGCFMKIKAAIAFTRCPVGKWGREKDLTTDQLSVLKRLLSDISPSRVSRDKNIGLTNLYNEIFGMNKKVSSCGSCVKQLIQDMKDVLSSYEDRE
tara:strand:- start:434 stop:814 length:381 start_codon:yes stop_codon:yes gene_type:complete